MIYRLSDRVWWGDRDAPFEAGCNVRAVVNVADNPSGAMSDYFAKLAELHGLSECHADGPLYLWLPWGDYHEPDVRYLERLHAVAHAVVWTPLVPVLVHCQRGFHRSPAVAIFLEWCFNKQTRLALDTARAAALKVNPSIYQNITFHAALMRYCEKHCRPEAS